MLTHIKFNAIVGVALVLCNQSMLDFLQSSSHFYVFSAIYLCLIMLVVHIVLSLNKFIAKPLAWLLISAAILTNIFSVQFGTLINTSMLENAFATDARELSDLFSFNLALKILGGLIISALPIYKLNFTASKWLAKLSYGLALLLILLALIFSNSQILFGFLRSHDQIRYLNSPFYQFYALGKIAKQKILPAKPKADIALDARQKDFSPEANSAINFSLLSEQALSQDADFKISPESKGRLFVLVVGETARADNYSAGTYKINDTNFYTKNLPLVFLNNFYSCGTATATSLPCMFSMHKREDFSKTEAYKGVLNVLKRFVKVVWLDNNSGGCKGVCDEVESLEKSQRYDAWLLDELKKVLINAKPYLSKGGDLLVILHIQGSHGPSYFKRYPAEFERFKPVCLSAELSNCKEDEIVNAYDNSLLYTDFINASAFKLALSAKPKELAFMYLSDHGESLGERGIYLHGLPYALAPMEQKHIPAQIYASGYDFSALKNTPLSQDNLYHSLLGFFEISTKTYDKSLDLFALAKHKEIN